MTNTNATSTRYQVVTADTWHVVADGFYTYDGACGWADAHDYGQWEDDGGLMVMAYTVDE